MQNNNTNLTNNSLPTPTYRQATPETALGLSELQNASPAEQSKAIGLSFALLDERDGLGRRPSLDSFVRQLNGAQSPETARTALLVVQATQLPYEDARRMFFAATAQLRAAAQNNNRNNNGGDNGGGAQR